MRRTNIYLADEQCSALDEIARSNGTSCAELVRRLIDQAIGPTSRIWGVISQPSMRPSARLATKM